MAKKRKPHGSNWIFINNTTNNALRTNNMKTKIDNAQPNSRLSGDIDETINLIISEYGKVTQKEWMSGLTGWERWSIGNRAKDWNFAVRGNVLQTNQNRPKKRRPIEFSETLRQKMDYPIRKTRHSFRKKQQKGKKNCPLMDLPLQGENLKKGKI